jgi:hypothetical protein
VDGDAVFYFWCALCVGDCFDEFYTVGKGGDEVLSEEEVEEEVLGGG